MYVIYRIQGGIIFVKKENFVATNKKFQNEKENNYDFSGFACLNGSCKFCTAQGKKVYVRVVEIVLFEEIGVVYSVASIGII